MMFKIYQLQGAQQRDEEEKKKNWNDAKKIKNNGNKNFKLNYENLYALW